MASKSETVAGRMEIVMQGSRKKALQALDLQGFSCLVALHGRNFTNPVTR
ncbi:hypothetical protein [Paracidovorax avenae]|nr:hypothetical protein [Paracidovorax avenae]